MEYKRYNPLAVLWAGAFSHFGASFYPHALHAFFKIESHELVNQVPDIEHICKTGIGDKLRQANSHCDKVQVVSKFLFAKLNEHRRRDLLTNHIFRLNEIDDTTSIFNLSKKYNLSERQMERNFKISVGVSPKKFQRIIRFEKSLRLLTHADYNQLASIAYELNYSDQSHFINDFKDFSGMTPYEFVKNPTFGSESSSFIYDPDVIN